MHRLRGHHLICLHFFTGSYDKKFQENLKRVLEEISEVEVIERVDDVCRACPYNKGFCSYSPLAEEEVRRLDEFALKILRLNVRSRIKWSELKAKIPELIEDWKSFACKKCDWRGDCGV